MCVININAHFCLAECFLFLRSWVKTHTTTCAFCTSEVLRVWPLLRCYWGSHTLISGEKPNIKSKSSVAFWIEIYLLRTSGTSILFRRVVPFLDFYTWRLWKTDCKCNPPAIINNTSFHKQNTSKQIHTPHNIQQACILHDPLTSTNIFNIYWDSTCNLYMYSYGW